MTTKKFRWSTPHEWLMHKAQQWDENELFAAVDALAGRVDNDAIQDLFQEEMSSDGYFSKLKDETGG